MWTVFDLFRVSHTPERFLTTSRDLQEPDSELAARVAHGDQRAFGALYDRHGRMAFSLALAIVQNSADAEEVVADGFLRVWRTAADFDAGRGSVAAWLATIVRTRALDLVRSRKRRSTAMDRAAAMSEAGAAPGSSQPGIDAEREVESSDLRRALRRGLDALPPRQRRVLELAYFGGLSQSEIASALAEPLGTVKTRMRTGMEKLRELLVPELERER